MSANNYISIDHRQELTSVSIRDADTGHLMESYKVKNLREALQKAIDLFAEGDIEYGITHIDQSLLKPKKRRPRP